MRRKTKSSEPPSPALERAALLGRGFSLPLLIASGTDRTEIARLFDDGTLVAGENPTDACFADESLAGKITRRIPWSSRRDHHLALGRAAERQRFPAEEIAAHFEVAQRFDLARVQWTKAGEAACAEGNYRKALRWLDRALAIWQWDDAAEDRVRVLREMARCAANARLTDAARKAWEELAGYARDSGRHGLRVDSLRHLAAFSEDAAKTGGLLLEAAETAGRELAPAEAFRHWLNYVDHLANRVRIKAAGAALQQAEMAAGKLADPAIDSELLGWKALLAALGGKHADATRYAAESLRLAVDHQLTDLAALAYRRHANIAEYAGDYQAEKDAQNFTIRFCRESDAGGEIVCLSCLAYACFRTGDWKEALDTARKVLAVPGTHPVLRAIALGVRGMIASFRGERGPALRNLDECVRVARAEGMVSMEFFCLWALAYCHESNGDTGTAGRIYDEIRALWRETDDLHDVIPGLLFAGAHYADTGRSAPLGDCIDILGKISETSHVPEVRAALLALTAELAHLENDPAAAGSAFKEAALLYQKSGLPFERIRVEWRRMRCDAAGFPEVNRLEILDAATRLGLRPLLPGLRGSDTTGDLTPRQREVLVLLAAGSTSKEIGGRLGLSTRTVEMHVSRLLQRMNCRTRSEAVGHAVSLGWIR